MEILKYLLNKKVYVLVNIIILLVGYILIIKGLNIVECDSSISGVYVSIGTSLIATGIIIFLDLWKRLSVKNITRRIKNIINDGGIQWVYRKRDLDRYDQLIGGLDKGIDICGYSLGGFFESFNEIIKEKATNKKVKIRVLFVDPLGKNATQRAIIEGKSVVLFQERIDTFVNYFKSIENVEIRFIDLPLSTMIYRIDDVMFVGPHFYKRQSKSTLTMELSSKNWMFDEYQNEFNRMWEDAKTKLMTKKYIIDAFKQDIIDEGLFWRTSRRNTFIDLLTVESFRATNEGADLALALRVILISLKAIINTSYEIIDYKLDFATINDKLELEKAKIILDITTLIDEQFNNSLDNNTNIFDDLNYFKVINNLDLENYSVEIFKNILQSFIIYINRLT